jgi:hypothetical protein
MTRMKVLMDSKNYRKMIETNLINVRTVPVVLPNLNQIFMTIFD